MADSAIHTSNASKQEDATLKTEGFSVEAAQTAQGNAGQAKGMYRKLGQPADTVSGATQELFEVRPSGAASSDSSNNSSVAFKAIAVLAIVALLCAIVASQLGLL